MQNNLLKLIKEEIDEFENKQIQIVPGFLFNQQDTIEKCYRLYNSKFENGDIDADGDKKYFFNIVRNPCKVTTKAIDFDTKDIKIITDQGGDSLKTWFYEKDLKFWMKDKNFGAVLNRIFNELPIFGSVVLKIVNGEPYFVDLRNFFISQSADTLADANYIMEKHLYSPMQFTKMGKKYGWKDLDKTMGEFRKMQNVDYICVWERYGQVEEGEGDIKKYPYKRVFVADVGIDEYDQNRQLIPYSGVILKEEEIDPDDSPYWEFHMDKLPGRWLGVGIIESIFDPQIRQNEIANLQSKGSFWAALRLFQTRDQGINRNLMTDVRNGEVLKVDGEVTQIDMTDRNLAFFNEETQKWMRNRDENTFSFDIMQGDRLPAGTPARSAILAMQMATSYFNLIQENVALSVKELLFKIILPKFETLNGTEHYIRLVGEDLDKLNELIINQTATNELFTYIFTKGAIPSMVEFDVIKATVAERAKASPERMVKIPKEFYKDLKYKIEIDITGESIDEPGLSQVIMAALQAMTVDPMVLQDPLKKKMLFQALELQGLNMSKFDDVKPMDMNQLVSQTPVKGAGGGVSAPVPMATTPTTNTI